MNEDKAARYHRLKRRTSFVSRVWSALLLGTLLTTGGSVSMRDIAERLSVSVPTALSSVVIVATYVTLLTILHEVGSLPIGWFGGFVIERRYNLSSQNFRGWLTGQAKALVLSLVIGTIGVEIVYAFMRRAPWGWWLPTGMVFALLLIGLANLGPVLLMPLFYRVRPLARESLRQRLVSLAERSGARVLGAYEWGLGTETRKANAALTGLGGTRRILVSDTMLAEYSDEEIEVVFAHELAHHVHGDIWKGMVFESLLILAGCFAASRVMGWGVSTIGLRSGADIAGLPLLLLVSGAVSLVMVPAAHAMSRHSERRADRFALTLTGNPAAFVSAMKRLGAQNLAEEDPTRLVRWLFHSHPPIGDRIDAARRFTD